jgi:hypothetical protein
MRRINSPTARGNMHELTLQPGLSGRFPRRKALGAFICGLGALSLGSEGWARPAQDQGMKEMPSSPANQARTSLHQEIDYKVHAQRIYEILLDAKQFAAFTGMPADIDAKPGGAFSLFGGMSELCKPGARPVGSPGFFLSSSLNSSRRTLAVKSSSITQVFLKVCTTTLAQDGKATIGSRSRNIWLRHVRIYAGLCGRYCSGIGFSGVSPVQYTSTIHQRVPSFNN